MVFELRVQGSITCPLLLLLYVNTSWHGLPQLLDSLGQVGINTDHTLCSCCEELIKSKVMNALQKFVMKRAQVGLATDSDGVGCSKMETVFHQNSNIGMDSS